MSKAQHLLPSSRKRLTTAVLMALSAMAAAPAMAVPSDDFNCMWGNSALETVNDTRTLKCRLGEYPSSATSLHVTSTGLIQVAGDTGVVLNASGTALGSILNEGEISATGTAGQSAAMPATSATAGGSANGISMLSGTITDITNSGTAIRGTGGNGGGGGGTMMSGANGGDGNGIRAANGTIGNLTNSSTIAGSGGNGGSTVMAGPGSGGNGSGIYLTSSATLTTLANTGTISGIGGNSGSAAGMSASAGTGTGISLTSGATLTTLTNSGTISGIGGSNTGIGTSGTGKGISAVNSTIGTLTNDGTISGTGGTVGIGGGVAGAGYGLAIDNSTVDAIINNGVISGSTAAISLTGTTTVTNGITNTGQINGNVFLNGATLNLNGTTGSVSGTVQGIAGSTVNVNGTFTSGNTFNVGTFNIANGGRFTMGHGVTTSAGVNNAGTLAVAAGNTVTIIGDYTQAASGQFETGLSDANTYGKLIVTGTADLSASNKINVNVVGAPALVAGTSAQPGVISAATLNAGPALTVTDNSALFDFIATKNGNAIDLCVAHAGSTTCSATPDPAPTPTPAPAPSITVLSSVTNTRNTPGLGAAQVFDNLIAQGNTVAAPMVPIITALGTLPTEQAVSDAVRQTLPLMTAGMAEVNSAALQATNRVIQSRQEANRGLSSGDEFIGDRQIWFKPVGSWARQDDRNNVSGYKADTYGMVFGVDRVVSDQVRLGGAFSYMHSSVDSNTGMQHATVDGYRLIGYGSYSLDPRTDLSFQADVGTGRNKGNRAINFGGLNAVATSSYSSWNAHVGAGLGRIFDIDAKSTFTPSARIDYTYIRDNAYTETGANALNLNVAKNSTDELILAVDGKLNYAVSRSTILSANLGGGYDVLSSQSSINAAYVGGGGQFVTRGLDPSPWLVRGGLGLTVTNGNAMEVTARYDIERRDGFANHTASVKLRMPF
ncbi:outer membrane autotransporter protein [Paucimonas lemoignei]|uniref:Outer membrane autotransporter protein n=1 Tax=Paucimonas lemoignei TaxID=29443 RepID=A0A4R3HXD4_PAULE|nr:autotransporter outer membrane beta-barrel domain-containing protein [Paucimonas lemoignei]TCS37987.1 outer membrane autotransporter protein [Paucimonas lemoignei]